MNKDIYVGLEKVVRQKAEAALITVVNVLGSTPRKPGAKMLVLADGTTVGTIGGGCGEAEGMREALNVIASGAAKGYSLNMTAEMAEEEGMVCGGVMELFIDYLGPRNTEEQTEFLQAYLAAVQGAENPTLVTVVDAPDRQLLGRKLFARNYGGTAEFAGGLGMKELDIVAKESAQIESKTFRPQLMVLDNQFEPARSSGKRGDYRLFMEPMSDVRRLLILGAGHIAIPLAAMAKIVGYEVTVVDDRPSFANALRFPDADEVICDNFASALEKIEIDAQTFVVIVTRGHRYDKVCLRRVIDRPAAYIGMIGSRKRVKALFAELEEDGVSRTLLEKVYSPIGLKIGAETPAEIAVCILGELIQVQKRPGG